MTSHFSGMFFVLHYFSWTVTACFAALSFDLFVVIGSVSGSSLFVMISVSLSATGYVSLSVIGSFWEIAVLKSVSWCVIG